MEKKEKNSQSSQFDCNMSNIFGKLSLKDGSDSTPFRVKTKMENFAIKGRSADGTKNVHVNDSLADIVTKHISSLSLSDDKTSNIDYKNSTLTKCNNKIIVYKNCLDESLCKLSKVEDGFLVNKDIKVNEFRKNSEIAAETKTKFNSNKQDKLLPDYSHQQIDIDNKTKLRAIDKFPNNLGTISSNNSSGKIVNTDLDVLCFDVKNIKIEEVDELDFKSEFSPVSFNDPKFDNLDIHKSSKYLKVTQGIKDEITYVSDCELLSDSDDNKDTPVKAIIERNPTTKTSTVNFTWDYNSPTSNLNATSSVEENFFGSFENPFSLYSEKQATQLSPLSTQEQLYSTTTCSPEIIEADVSINKHIELLKKKHSGPLPSFKYNSLSCNLNATSSIVGNCYGNFKFPSGLYSENQAIPLSPLPIQEQLYLTTTYSPEIEEADASINKYLEDFKKKHSQSTTSCFKYNDLCNINYPDNYKNFESIDKSYNERYPNHEVGSSRQIRENIYSCNQLYDFRCIPQSQVENYSVISSPPLINPVQNSYNMDFSEADKVLAKRSSATPKSNYCSSDSKLNYLSRKNDKRNNFSKNMRYVPNSPSILKGDSGSHQPSVDSSKKNYLKPIASKGQQNYNSELELTAIYKLMNSKYFSRDQYNVECQEMYSQIMAGEIGTEDKKVIHRLRPTGEHKYIRTNLHKAVMDGKIEKALCIVEIYKELHGDVHFDITSRDNKGWTVLDRARNINSPLRDLFIAYLNVYTSEPGIHHMRPINTPGT